MAKICRSLPASGIRNVFEKAKEIEKGGAFVYHLEMGRPDWKLFPGVTEEAKSALDNGLIHYISNRGLTELRMAVSEDIERRTGRRFNYENEIIITSGATEALSMCGLALLGPGDEVIIPQPAWNHYMAVVKMAGATPVPLNLSDKNGFLLDPEVVEKAITQKTKMLILNTPNNPTGAVQPAEYLEEIANLAIRHGFFIFSDEVYQDFVYTGEHVSISRYMLDSEFLLYVNSFSKSYTMTGWRIGYIASDSIISDALNRIHQYLTACGVPFSQKGAVGILNHPNRNLYLNEMKHAFSQRYAVWRDVLKNCKNIQIVMPAGAFYLFPQIEYKGMSARDFCQFMLEVHRVAMVPGDVFGEGYNKYVRISYGGDTDTQKKAAKKLTDILNS